METAVENTPAVVAEAQPKTVVELLKEYAAVAKKLAKVAEKAKADSAPLQNELDGLKVQLEAWAATNKEQFGGKKMLDLGLGSIGWKMGERKLALPLDLNQAWYLKTIEEQLPSAIEKKVDPKKLITGLDHNPALAEVLRKRKITVTQQDNFTIILKK